MSVQKLPNPLRGYKTKVKRGSLGEMEEFVKIVLRQF
jgi:hypothetical protein